MNRFIGYPLSTNRTGDGNSHISSPTLILLVLVATLGALLYLNFILTPANRGDILPYLLVLIAEAYMVCQALMALWTILAGKHNPRGFDYHNAQDRIFGRHGSKSRYGLLDEGRKQKVRHATLYLHEKPAAVDVFVTVYGEPLDVISKTVVAARDMFGKHETYILDDGKSDDVKKLAKQLKVTYLRRPDNQGAKAGNINHALSKTSGEFFVILDADFVAHQDFLYETVPFFEDRSIAFVQTPQHYTNLDNTISRGAGYMQRLFYRLIQPGKNRFNAAFCVGTNVVFRRKAVESIGGMYTGSKSEDIWTSILLHEAGWRSVFIPDILALGQTPDTIKAYSKQQLRWATGGFQILLRHNPMTKKLTIDQKLQYLSTCTYYLHGLAAMILLALPLLHIFFNLTPVNLHIAFAIWLVYYLAFYGMQIVLALYTMEGFRIETMLLATASFPIYVRAFVNALRGKEEAWSATGNRSQMDSPFNYIIPQVMIFAFLCFAAGVGIWKAYYYQALSLSLFWCLLNAGMFGSFILIALKEHRQLKKAVRAERKQTTLPSLRQEPQEVIA